MKHPLPTHTRKALHQAPADRQGLGEDRPRLGNTGALLRALILGGR